MSVLITGGTRGLGLAIAELFAKQGKTLILTYRSDEENAQAVKKRFADCHVIRADLAEDGASDALFEKVRTIAPSLSVYVHNAAATAFKPLMEIGPHHVHKTYNITVTSFIRNVQLAVPLMTAGGAVISISGMDTRQVVPHHGLLGAAKASLETLTLYFAHELAKENVRVNGVNPGYLETDSTKKYFGAKYDEANRFIAALTPGRKPAKLEDVAAVVEFLASEKARWIVGQTISVDGGQILASPASLTGAFS